MIHAATRMGHVHLTVADLDRSISFYQDVLGFSVHGREEKTAHLGAGRHELLRLTENPRARQVRGTTGLYHFAVLTARRRDLAWVLERIGNSGAPLQGVVDHWFSEAIYLADPDGNGVEVYHDRPRDQWPPLNTVVARGNGPVDIDELMSELEDAGGERKGLHADTTIGHVHLQVPDIQEAEAFYHGLLGFEKMMKIGDSAGFVAAGGYHHHIAYNVWAGVGAPSPPVDAAGLRYFTIVLPNEAERDRVLNRMRSAGLRLERNPEGFLAGDPSRNGVLISTRHEADAPDN